MPNIRGVSAWRLLVYQKHLSRRIWNTLYVKFLYNIDFDIGEDRIEACHRLTKSDCTIVKFSRRKDCQHLMNIKKGLKDLNSTNLSFPEGTKIYVNDRLCPQYRGLWNECKKRGNDKKIYWYFTVYGALRFKQVENGPYKTIPHVNNLRALLPRSKFPCLELFRYLQAVLFVLIINKSQFFHYDQIIVTSVNLLHLIDRHFYNSLLFFKKHVFLLFSNIHVTKL